MIPSMSIRRWLRYWLPGIALIATAGACPAQELFSYNLQFATGVPRVQPITPGGEGTLSFTVHNNSPDNGYAAIYGRIEPDPAALSEYEFVANAPQRCLPPDIATQLNHPSLRLRAGPLAPGTSQTCTYRVRRSAASRNDLRFRLCGPLSSFPYCATVFHLGTLPELSFRVTQEAPVGPGATNALVRLTVENHAGRDVLRRILTTGCSEFGGGIFAPAPFEVETGFPGACTPAEYGEACLNFTGQNFSSRAFAPGPIAAGGSTSCLVRLRFRVPLQQAVSLPMHFHQELVEFVDGGVGYAPGSDVDAQGFGAAPSLPVPLGRGAMALAVLLLAVVGWVALRHRATSARRRSPAC